MRRSILMGYACHLQRHGIDLSAERTSVLYKNAVSSIL